MGLLKKKPDDAAGDGFDPGAEPDARVAATATDGEVAQPPLETAPAAAIDGAVLGAEATGDDDAAAGDAPADPEGATPAADGTEALLNMFASSQAGSDDRELLVELAGEVEVADLVDQARTLAAAMNIALAAE